MSDETTPSDAAKTVASNTTDTPRHTAPPAVSSSPSADTRGDAGTSTAEGPSEPTRPLPDDAGSAPLRKSEADGKGEIAPPGERVDDEHEGRADKRLTRQE